MMGPTHAAAGLAAGLGVAAISGNVDSTPVAAYGVAAFAALLPDLDQHRSIASRYAINKPAHVVLRHFRHRRFTHSLLGTALFGLLALTLWSALAALVGSLSHMFAVLALAGYASHILADAFNKQGVQLLYPFAPRVRLPLLGRISLEWISIPLPRALRISTIYDPQGPPITLGRLQARIPTELLFFKLPVWLVIAFIAWHQLDPLVVALRHDVWNAVALAPEPLRPLLETALR